MLVSVALVPVAWDKSLDVVVTVVLSRVVKSSVPVGVEVCQSVGAMVVSRVVVESVVSRFVVGLIASASRSVVGWNVLLAFMTSMVVANLIVRVRKVSIVMTVPRLRLVYVLEKYVVVCRIGRL